MQNISRAPVVPGYSSALQGLASRKTAGLGKAFAGPSNVLRGWYSAAQLENTSVLGHRVYEHCFNLPKGGGAVLQAADEWAKGSAFNQ